MILILGGTAEARDLAAELTARGQDVVTSLAGRVAQPRLPAGRVRIGGFGGPEALASWLGQYGADRVIDATHPFAERITASALTACAVMDVPFLRLERPGWSERPGDRWTWVDDLGAAATAIARVADRAFLTTGRQGLEAFAASEAWCLIRCVDPPSPPLPSRHEVILDRGPYSLAGEGELLDYHRIDVVVTKDSGSDHTVAKLDAARLRGLPVIVVRRPPRLDLDAVTKVEAALAWAAHAG